MKTKLCVVRGLVMYKDKFLLLKTNKDIDSKNLGKWEIPGGKIEKDEDYKVAMLRELKEETGLDCKLVKDLPWFIMDTGEVVSEAHVYLLEANTDKVILSKEHSDYAWLTPEELPNYDLVFFGNLLYFYTNNLDRFRD